MDSLFVQFQREYCSAVQELRKHVNGRAADGSQGLLEEVKIIVGKLKMEARTLPADMSRHRLAEVRGYEAEVRQLEAMLQQKVSTDSRAQLLGQQADVAGQRADVAGQDGAAHRDRLLSNTQKLQGSSERIKQSWQMMADMEAQGATILQSLHDQRETIQRSQQKLHEADENITASQKILRRMGRWLPF